MTLSYSHTHCQVAQADTQTETWQRVCLFPTHGLKDNAANLMIKLDKNINSKT